MLGCIILMVAVALVVIVSIVRSTRDRAARPFLLACLFLSSAAEVAILMTLERALIFIFGSAVMAELATLTALPLGLTIGYLLFGKLVDRQEKPLLLFAGALVLIAASALAVPYAVIELYGPFNEWLWTRYEERFWTLSVLRFLFMLFLLLPLCIAMGGSIPILVRHLSNERLSPALSVSVLYALKAGGGLTGGVSAIVLLLPEIGQRPTMIASGSLCLLLAALLLLPRLSRASVGRQPEHEFRQMASGISGVMLCCGAGLAIHTARDVYVPWLVVLAAMLGFGSVAMMLLLARRRREGSQAVTPTLPTQPDKAGPTRLSRFVLITSYLCIGAVEALFHAIWSRGAAISIGSSTVASTMVDMTFLTGCVLGAALCAAFLPRREISLLHLVGVQVFIGVGIALAYLAADDLTVFHARAVAGSFVNDPSAVQGVQTSMFMLWGLVALPVSMGMGAALPLTVAAFGHVQKRLGTHVGVVLASGVAGSVLGALSTLLIRGVESFHFFTCLCCALCSAIAIGILVAHRAGPHLRTARYVFSGSIAVTCCLFVLLVPRWDLDSMTLGTFRMALGDEGVSAVNEPDLVFYFDGDEASIRPVKPPSSGDPTAPPATDVMPAHLERSDKLAPERR